jgi:hypothetical protein
MTLSSGQTRTRGGTTVPTVPDAATNLGDDVNLSMTAANQQLGTDVGTVPNGSRGLTFSVETFDVRVRAGAAATATNGCLFRAGGVYTLAVDPATLRFFGIGGTAIVNVLDYWC